MSAENTVLETAMDALYRYVAPARSWAFECVALLQLREKFPSDPKVQTQLETCIERFEQTSAALQGEIATCFEKAEHPPNDEMFAIHKASVAAVEDMLRRVRACYKHQPSDAELLEMLQLCQGYFWDAMSKFVTGFSQYQRDILAYRADQDTKVMREAIVEIVDLSSSINLISVNASVEAARAGVAGRGFAVIANEIRNLSLKSQDLTEFVRSRLT